jgi:ParB family chromosome partitioning protein
LRLAEQAAESGWSVRELEERARSAPGAKPAVGKKGARQPVHADPNIAALQNELSEKLGAKVKIEHRGGKGRLLIEYFSLDELDGILARIR